jgi:two-component system, LytTR family, sensor kinase
VMLAGWAAVVVLFSLQWFAYDESRGTANPISYYLGWSCLLWALAPVVFRFARRYSLQRLRWHVWLMLHLAAGAAVGAVQVLIEASLAWARLAPTLSFSAALSHYFTQHVQLYLLTYWSVIAAAELVLMRDKARERELRATRLRMQLGAARLDALRAQLRPHFLFNTLQTSVELVHQDPAAAEDVLLRLSSLLRVSLGEYHSNEISLGKELEFLDSYVAIQRRRFGERLDIQLDIAPRVSDLAVPSLLLQPLVENAIQHGIGTHKGSDRLLVRAQAEGGRLTLQVVNGLGALPSDPRRLVRGVGLANTRARLQELYGDEQSIELGNLERGGVCVTVIIPARAPDADGSAATLTHPA